MAFEYFIVPQSTKFVEVNDVIVPLYLIKIYEPIHLYENVTDLMNQAWDKLMNSFTNDKNQLAN